MNIVIELEFPWDESGTRQEELDFAEVCLRLISDGALGVLSPIGGKVTNVRAIRGSMAVARSVTSREQ